MSTPQEIPRSVPGKPMVLRIRNTYTVYFSNGQKRLVEQIFYYGPGSGMCNGPSWSPSQKTGLVTYATGVSATGVAGVPTGVTTLYGFQQTVLQGLGAPLVGGVNVGLNTMLSVGALSAGIYAKWIDQVTDADLQVGTYAPALPQTSASVGNGTTQGGGRGTLANRLPLDNHVTIRKYTGVAGKEWSRGRWKLAPVCEADVAADELIAGVAGPPATGQVGWGALKIPFYSPITDGTTTNGIPNVLWPILVSTKLSQLRIAPTRVVFAPLILPGINYVTQVTNQIINMTMGEQKKRKEHPDLVF